MGDTSMSGHSSPSLGRPFANKPRRRGRRRRVRASDLVDMGVCWTAIGVRNELGLWAVQGESNWQLHCVLDDLLGAVHSMCTTFRR